MILNTSAPPTTFQFYSLLVPNLIIDFHFLLWLIYITTLIPELLSIVLVQISTQATGWLFSKYLLDPTLVLAGLLAFALFIDHSWYQLPVVVVHSFWLLFHQTVKLFAAPASSSSWVAGSATSLSKCLICSLWKPTWLELKQVSLDDLLVAQFPTLEVFWFGQGIADTPSQHYTSS